MAQRRDAQGDADTERLSSDRWAAPDGKRGAPALAVDSLTKRFGDRVAFRDVSFEVGYGEVFGFLGPYGAGKPDTGLRHYRYRGSRAGA
jgi:ABC-type glutathione transport system ATPase component